MKMLSGCLYDYILFYECAAGDWVSGKGSQKLQIMKAEPGTLMNYINWNVGGTTVEGDSGGNTKCGVTQATWESWYRKNSKKYGITTGTDVNKMDKRGWLSLIDSIWVKCANDACSIVLFQCKWGGWSKADKCLKKLKEKSDVRGYSFKSSGDVYARIADATHAFKNPMDAFQIIRDEHQQYLYDISAPGKKNSRFRQGWMRREVAPFQDDGLYVESGGISRYTSDTTTLHEWRAICSQQKGKMAGYVKLCSWDNMPSNPEAFDDVDVSALVSETRSSGKGGKFSSVVRDPHLSAKKDVVLNRGILLGSSFNIK